MAKRKKTRVVREPPPKRAEAPTAVAYKPQREVIEIHTTRERKRNASGEALSGNMLLPVVGGIVAGTGAVLAAQKWSQHPGVIAGIVGAGGLYALSRAKQNPSLARAGAGAVVGAATVAAVPYVVGALAKSAPSQQAQAHQNQLPKHRGAETGGFVTREELNEALAKVADQQKQGHCDLLSALDDIRKIVANAEQQQNRALPPSDAEAKGPGNPGPLPPQRSMPPQRLMFLRPGDAYSRNAYGEDERNADLDTYERNAYGDEERNADVDERNAVVDEYTASAYGGRNADDERNAYVDEDRNAGFDEDRNADVEERNADDWN